MAQATVSFRMDENLKRQMERLCDDIGMNLTTAFTVFAKKAVRERRIPFELDADSVYTEVVTKEYLDRAIAAMDAGQGKEHELLKTLTKEELLRRIAAMDAGQGKEHELLEIEE